MGSLMILLIPLIHSNDTTHTTFCKINLLFLMDRSSTVATIIFAPKQGVNIKQQTDSQNSCERLDQRAVEIETDTILIDKNRCRSKS